MCAAQAASALRASCPVAAEKETAEAAVATTTTTITTTIVAVINQKNAVWASSSEDALFRVFCIFLGFLFLFICILREMTLE